MMEPNKRIHKNLSTERGERYGDDLSQVVNTIRSILASEKYPEQCETCKVKSYKWSIKQPLWNSTKCWQHLGYSGRTEWRAAFIKHATVAQDLHEVERRRGFSRYLREKLGILTNKYGDQHINSISPSDHEHIKTKDSLYAEYITHFSMPTINLQNVDLSGADLPEANLEKVDLSGANLQGTNLAHSILSNSQLQVTDLREANLTLATIDHCNFSKADLTLANLASARAQKSTFEKSKLDSANFSGTQLNGSSFSNSIGHNTHFQEANMTECNLSQADLQHSIFFRADLYGSNLTGANLKSADLRAADLRKSQLEKADISYADLRDAKLFNVDLHLAIHKMTRVYLEDLYQSILLTTQLTEPNFKVERREKVKVFICYSHSDSNFAHQLANALESRSIDVWIDVNEIMVGDSLLSKISEGVANSRFVCAILSKYSLESKWVTFELESALYQEVAASEIKILPLVVEHGLKLPEFLIGKLYIDFSKPEFFTTGVNQIVKRINKSQIALKAT